MQYRYTSLDRMRRKAKKDKLVANGIMSQDNTAVELHNAKIMDEGTKRTYLHPTKGYRKINRERDMITGAGPAFGFAVFYETIAKAHAHAQSLAR